MDIVINNWFEKTCSKVLKHCRGCSYWTWCLGVHVTQSFARVEPPFGRSLTSALHVHPSWSYTFWKRTVFLADCTSNSFSIKILKISLGAREQLAHQLVHLLLLQRTWFDSTLCLVSLVTQPSISLVPMMWCQAPDIMWCPCRQNIHTQNNILK